MPDPRLLPIQTAADAENILRKEVTTELADEIEATIKESDRQLLQMTTEERSAYVLLRAASVKLIEYLRRW